MPINLSTSYGVEPYVLQTNFPPSFGFEGLSVLLGKDVATIKADRCRAPHKIPPGCMPPGTKSPRWLLTDVLAWLASHREEEPVQPMRRPGRPKKSPPPKGIAETSAAPEMKSCPSSKLRDGVRGEK